MAKIKTFELDRWSEPDEKRRVRHIGMADAKETFDRLQTHLELKGLLPDEYFLFSDELTGELPEFDQALCIPNFGASEGIYLDISLACRDKDGKRYFQNFATGKTLGETADDYYRMFRMNPNNISEVVYYFLQDKGAEYRGDLLYERAKAEFDARMEELAALPPKEILDHAYEKIIKEDFLCHLEEGLDEWETDALLSYPQPLAALYTEWMGVDYSYLDIDRIQSTAKQAAGKRLNELRRHEFDVNGEPPAELRYFYDLHSEILDTPDLEWVGDMEP